LHRGVEVDQTRASGGEQRSDCFTEVRGFPVCEDDWMEPDRATPVE
jgi:hypothetical protein